MSFASFISSENIAPCPQKFAMSGLN